MILCILNVQTIYGFHSMIYQYHAETQISEMTKKDILVIDILIYENVFHNLYKNWIQFAGYEAVFYCSIEV